MLMRIVLSTLFLCLATIPLQAATADLQVLVTAPEEASVGDLDWSVTIINHGPDVASEVTWASGVYRGRILEDAPCSGAIATLAAGARHEVDCTGTTESLFPYERTVSATVEAASSDPESSNDIHGERIRLITNPDLTVFVQTDIIDPGLPAELTAVISNLAYKEATGVAVEIEVPRVAGFVDLPGSCELLDETTVRCAVGSVPAAEPTFSPEWGIRSVTITLHAPDDPSGAGLRITSRVEGDQPDPQQENNHTELEARMFRTFWVTTTSDSGPGSLRSAIDEASTTCTGDDLCKIAFRIDADEPWKTVVLESPLPHVRGANVRIDGTTQTRFFGDLNPIGPEIELTGRELETAVPGLVFETTCSSELAGLTINGFGGAGVIGSGTQECESSPPAPVRMIRDSYIGTDPTGSIAMPNQRGIVIDYSTHFDLPIYAGIPSHAYQIEGNLVSGNTRSGIMSLAGTWRISHNIIGLNGAVSAGLGNGASGVYIGPSSHATDLVGNYIGFNRHFGVAIDRHADWVVVHGNSIQANWQKGIDIGLDGVTPVIGPFSNDPNDVLELPVITTAWWDESRQITILEGRVPNPPRTFLQNTVNLYANDAPDPSGHGEGQYFLGEVAIEEDGSFQHEVAGNLSDKWVCATATRRHYVGFAKPISTRGSDQGFVSVSTEFGPTILVQ